MGEDLSTLQEQYLIAVKVAGLGLGRVDYRADTITLDARGAEIFDLPAETAIPRDKLHARIHPDDREKINYQVDVLLDPEQHNYIDVQHRVVHDSGAIRWVNARKQVTFEDQAGALVPTRGLVAIMDITDHRAAQDRNEMLMAELNHRSKNLLTVVQGLVRQTFQSGPVETFEPRLSQRLDGLIRNAETLMKEAWQKASIEEIARGQIAAFGRVDGGRIRFEGPSLDLPGPAAQSMGMAFHELATNAIKYGALSTPEGRIDLTWGPAEEAEDMVEVQWIERGGPPVKAPEGSGFGSIVTTDLIASAVNGTVDMIYDPEGLTWHLRFPKSTLA